MSISASVSLVVGYDITGVELWTKTDESVMQCDCRRWPAVSDAYCSKCGKAVKRTWKDVPTPELAKLAEMFGVEPRHIYDPEEPSWSRAEVAHHWWHRDEIAGVILGKKIHRTGDLMNNEKAAALSQHSVADAFDDVCRWASLAGLNQEPKLWLVPSVG